MNRRLLISVLAVFILVAGSISIVSAYTVLDTAAVIRAEGQIPFTPGPLLDDFNTQTFTNAWNCITGAFSKSSAIPTPANEKCTVTYSADTPEGTGYSLKLNYDVSRPYEPGPPEYSTFAGYYSQLGGGNLATPTAYTALSFWVKGAVGGEFFKIQLKNSSTTLHNSGATQYYMNMASVYITDYLDGGVTQSWQKVTIPFHNFANLDGFSSMKEFVVVFENSQSTTNGSSTSGTIYIDNIMFETTPVSAARVDYFGDKLGVCALGGGMGTGANDGAPASLNKYSFSNTANEYDPQGSPYGLKLEYNVIAGYSYTFLIFGGGQDIDPDPATNKSGWIAIPHNFSAYTKLTFRIKAKSEAENPKQIKIELVDSAGARDVAIGSISGTVWQLYELPLSGFASLDKTGIKQLTFVFEDWRISGAGGSKTGVIFIDSIQFE